MAGISDKALKTPYAENKYRFNDGSELQNKEFSDGSGLEMYDANFRGYDTQLGRFWQIDPLGELSEDWSPYTFASDNPILLNDPLGLADDSANVIPDRRIQPVCILCTLPKPDVAKAAGPAPTESNVHAGGDDNQSLLSKVWDKAGEVAYAINDYNPLAQAYNWVSTAVTGHDSYGVQQNMVQATTRLLATVPADRAAGVIASATETIAGHVINEEITITEEGFMHVMQRHYPRSGMFLNKSKFTLSAREIVNLIKNSAQAPKLLQRGGNYVRIVNAGRIVGIDATTGHSTMMFSIITNKEGKLITAFPGLPGR